MTEITSGFSPESVKISNSFIYLSTSIIIMKLHKAQTLRILYFFAFCCTASWQPLIADFCKNNGLAGTQISLILSITPIMMFIVQPLYGILADKIGYKKTMLVASLFASISFLGYLYKQDLG